MASIQRSSMKDQVYELIKGRIYSQYYKSGEEIKILTLSKELGVSNTPIREALTMLVAEGLLTTSLNNKFRVIELNDEEMGEFNEMIRILLVGGYREAHRDGRDRGLGEMLRDAYEKQVQVLEAGDEQAYIEKAIAFDGCFVQVTGNERLINIYENASYLFYLFVRHTYWKELDNREKKLAEHRVLIDAVEKGDGPLVERLLEEHYDEHYNMM